MCHYNSAALDLTRILYLAVVPEVRRENYMELVEAYFNSLTDCLDKYEYLWKKPTLKSIVKDLDIASMFGQCTGIQAIPLVMSDKNDAFDLEKVIATDGDEGIDMELYFEDDIIEKIGPDIVEFAYFNNFP